MSSGPARAASTPDLKDAAGDINRRLTAHYGEPEPRPLQDPLSELIQTILSQNTADINSDRAYASLMARFGGDWQAVRAAPTSAIADAIRIGGLAEIKATRIKSILDEIDGRLGRLDLTFLHDVPLEEGRAFLRSLGGVGPKTAACVLLFACGKPALPVDTHVHRVSQRLGLVPEKANAEQAHALLEAIIPPDDVYRFHMNLIRHGRQICKAQRPLCASCSVNDLCPYPNKNAQPGWTRGQQTVTRQLEIAIEAARDAGRLQLRRFRKRQSVENKADNTPVTKTDLESEARIRMRLQAEFPSYGFLGEEGGEVTTTAGERWIVDPLDGTKKYVRGLPFFGPCIALEREGIVQLGVMFLPAMRELLWAERGSGAFRNGEPIHVSTTDHLERAYVVRGNEPGFLRRGWVEASRSPAGSAYHDPGFLDLYSYASLACGRIDGIIMVDEAPWDIAAASVIIEEAGGRLTDFSGEASVYHGTSATSNGHLHQALLSLVRFCR